MKIDTLLNRRGIDFEEHEHNCTFTAQRLAHEEHVSGYMVAKPVIVKTENGFAMCALAAPKHLDLKRVAEALHEPEVRLATEGEMVGLFPDCELGAEPPVGVLCDLPTVMDKQLLEDEFLVMQGGTHTRSIRMNCRDWMRLCDPIVATISTS